MVGREGKEEEERRESREGSREEKKAEGEKKVDKGTRRFGSQESVWDWQLPC